MSGTKRKGSGEAPDVSHHPTRKVDSMSSLVAEMLLRDPDADVTSPSGLPAVSGAVSDPANDSDAHDAVGLDMARLIEVRSSVAPDASTRPSHYASADDSSDARAFRSRKPRVVAVVVVILLLVGFVAAAIWYY